MTDCERIRPLLFPYIEREVEPAEAIEVADHLAGCTACKILIARKRRLAVMLDRGLEDRIPVGEDFVRSVMATLPDGPPPEADKPRRKRHLKIAGTLGILLGLAPTIAASLPGLANAPGLRWPGLDAHTGGGVFEAVAEITRGALLAVAGWIGGVPVELSLDAFALAPAMPLAAVALGALAACSGLIAFAAAGSMARSTRA